jgi:hypothetical protein
MLEHGFVREYEDVHKDITDQHQDHIDHHDVVVSALLYQRRADLTAGDVRWLLLQIFLELTEILGW